MTLNFLYGFLGASVLLNGVASIIAGALVYLENRKNIVNKTFAIFCFFMAFWSFGYFFPLVQYSEKLSLLSFQLLHVGALFIAVSHLAFVCAFLGIKRRKAVMIGYLINLIVLFFIPTKFFISSVVPKFDFNYWADIGLLYSVWLIIFQCYILYSVYLLVTFYRKSTGIQKRHIMYILLGDVITFSFGSTNFFLFYNINIAPYLTIFASAQVIAFAYIIVMRQLKKKIDGQTKALKTQNKEMKKVLDQQSDFIAASGHELRTPANVASMYMSVLEKKLEDDKTKKYFSSANTAIRKLISLIKRLLEIQHHDHDKIKLDLKETDIQEFMQEAYIDIKPIVKEKSITIHYDNKLEEKTELNIDPVQIRQVIQNLITNAIKFVPKDGTGAITIQLKTENKNIIISVTDNGCGVPEKTREIIFDKFRSNHILDGNGIGLGLYLCKKIMELHKGKIWCEDNSEGKGTVFRFLLPADLHE